ncbi:Nucleotide-diphospho-sugar transferase family protein [Striga hermonthica]|uniref:Nucleotide-diphospho-sugar transferase family protein n=1 Tax=Striga hermonthica TaxID=68872 RepID=A0A9N7RB10_STRHE|nr:Nucleotide-diphospho-sugar transferase family protein [Striga hermonthica]
MDSYHKHELNSTTCGGNHRHHRRYFFRVVVKMTSFVIFAGLIYFIFNESNYRVRLVAKPYSNSSFSSHVNDNENSLESILRRASMEDNKTVIITTLNAAWIEPNFIFDLFLESFKIGNRTQNLLKHLVVVALDQKAYSRCVYLHPHCFALKTNDDVDFSGTAHYMSDDYLKMMWIRIDFLRSVLEMGYDFVFSDADIMWLRNPFPRFDPNGDFQIACDFYRDNSTNMHNFPNGGFTYVKSNERTIEFYKFWHTAKDYFPGKHDQDVFNEIKFSPFLTRVGLRVRFLDTAYFGGLCEPSKDLDLVVTMHANCCIGIYNKMHDIRMVLDDWRKYTALSAGKGTNPSRKMTWTEPRRCGLGKPIKHKKKVRKD